MLRVLFGTRARAPALLPPPHRACAALSTRASRSPRARRGGRSGGADGASDLNSNSPELPVLDKQLKQLYMKVHPDRFSAYPAARYGPHRHCARAKNRSAIRLRRLARWMERVAAASVLVLLAERAGEQRERGLARRRRCLEIGVSCPCGDLE